MTRAGAIAFVLSVGVCGCQTAENVASTSAAVVTAPVRYVSKKLGGEPETTDTTVYENQPVETAPPPPQPTPSPAPRTITSTTTTASPPPQQSETHPSTSPTSHSTAAPPRSSSTSSAAQFPVAKPVPGKPGYVFSPYDPNGGYVDVSGYPSGSKVKDPYSQKIFLVP
jgi:hypothetical protein